MKSDGHDSALWEICTYIDVSIKEIRREGHQTTTRGDCLSPQPLSSLKNEINISRKSCKIMGESLVLKIIFYHKYLKSIQLLRFIHELSV